MHRTLQLAWIACTRRIDRVPDWKSGAREVAVMAD